MATTTASIPAGLQNVRQELIFVGGHWRAPATGRTIAVFNPATATVIAQVGEAGAEDVDTAVQAARKAFDSGPWRRMLPRERERILTRIAELIETHADELAYLESLDVGKPINEARFVDIPLSAEFFRYFAGWISKLHGATIPVNGPFLN